MTELERELLDALKKCVEALGFGMTAAIFKDGVIPGPAYDEALGAGMAAIDSAKRQYEEEG